MSPFDNQEGGEHYKNLEIQPAEFIQKNKLGFLEGCVIKRMCRHNSKGGLSDLKKAIDEIKKIAWVDYRVDLEAVQSPKKAPKKMDLEKNEVWWEFPEIKKTRNFGFIKNTNPYGRQESVLKDKRPQPTIEATPDKRVEFYDPPTYSPPKKKCKRCED